jgi:hypothetical protein
MVLTDLRSALTSSPARSTTSGTAGPAAMVELEAASMIRHGKNERSYLAKGKPPAC